MAPKAEEEEEEGCILPFFDDGGKGKNLLLTSGKEGKKIFFGGGGEEEEMEQLFLPFFFFFQSPVMGDGGIDLMASLSLPNSAHKHLPPSTGGKRRKFLIATSRNVFLFSLVAPFVCVVLYV